MLRSVLGVVRLLGRMVVFSRMATGAQALYVREDVQPGSPACRVQEIVTRARSENSPETGVFEAFGETQPPQPRGIVNLHMSLSSTGANSAVAPPKM